MSVCVCVCGDGFCVFWLLLFVLGVFLVIGYVGFVFFDVGVFCLFVFQNNVSMIKCDIYVYGHCYCFFWNEDIFKSHFCSN